MNLHTGSENLSPSTTLYDLSWLHWPTHLNRNKQDHSQPLSLITELELKYFHRA